MNYFIFFSFFRGWKDILEADAFLYSPYYPFKDHDALCMTVKKASGGSLEEVEIEQNANPTFTSIYPGKTIIN